VTESGPHVLIVDDEPQILRGLRVILRSAGFQVAQAATKREALDAIAVRPPDVMILDLVLPDGNGVEVCEEVRRWSTLPIIVLSAVGDEREKVRALDAGADDYVTKPFGTEELTARIRAALRRRDSGDGADPVVRVGPVTVDLAARRVTRDGDEIHLTPIEFELLRVLATHRGKLVTHRALLQDVWGPGYGEETHYLRVHIAHIRGKLERDPARPEILLTDAGVGYRLAPEP
jgi:two-component system, OmpR family, KDP operon response regulator KdpE